MDVITEGYFSLTSDEIEDRIDEACAIMAIIQDLRAVTEETSTSSPSPAQGPNPSRRFNPCVEIWKRIRLVPPWERHRLLEDLDKGSIKNLWKSTMSRYVLDQERAEDLSQGYSIFDDFPSQPGSVATYLGASEMFETGMAPVRFFVEDDKRRVKGDDENGQVSKEEAASINRSAWRSLQPPSRFKLDFFVHPISGDVIGRFILPFIGSINKWWGAPCYVRVKLDLTLTPIQHDSGADFTFEYPSLVDKDLNGWLVQEEGGEEGDVKFFLDSSHLPFVGTWPDPKKQMEEVVEGRGGSPLGSNSPRDYLRPAGPGVYVGCAYPSRDGGKTYNEEDCVYFMMVRKWRDREEYEASRLDKEDGEEDEEEGDLNQ